MPRTGITLHDIDGQNFYLVLQDFG
jgi:hypothetical protein